MFPRQNTHVVGQGLARLTAQFQSQPNCRAWLAAILQEMQALENATWAVFTQRALLTAPQQTYPATNVVFDIIGDLVGEPRQGVSDNDYVVRIRLRIAANRAIGAATDWSQFGAILLSAGARSIGFWGDQSGILFTASSLPFNGSLVAQVLARAVPNGEHGCFSFTAWPDGTDVAFGSIYDPTAGQVGYGSIYDSTAGGGTAAGAEF